MNKIIISLLLSSVICASSPSIYFKSNFSYPFIHGGDHDVPSFWRKWYTGVLDVQFQILKEFENKFTLGPSFDYIHSIIFQHDTTWSRLHVFQCDFKFAYSLRFSKIQVLPYIDIGFSPLIFKSNIDSKGKLRDSDYHFAIDSDLGIQLLFPFSGILGIGLFIEYEYIRIIRDVEDINNILFLKFGINFTFSGK